MGIIEKHEVEVPFGITETQYTIFGIADQEFLLLIVLPLIIFIVALFTHRVVNKKFTIMSVILSFIITTIYYVLLFLVIYAYNADLLPWKRVVYWAALEDRFQNFSLTHSF